MAESKYQAIPEWMQKVRKLCKLDEGLQDNEVDFVESLSHRSINSPLSPKQLEWLNSIYAKHF
jgi:hypothetical protein